MDIATNRILEFLENYIDVDDSVNADSQLIADLGFNSLLLLEMVNDTEEEFDVIIDDDELPSMITVGDIVRMLQSKNVSFS